MTLKRNPRRIQQVFRGAHNYTQMLHGTGIFAQPFPLIHVGIFHLSCIQVNNPYIQRISDRELLQNLGPRN